MNDLSQQFSRVFITFICAIVVSSVCLPVPVAAIQTSDRNPALAEVVDETQETPAKQQHAAAVVLLPTSSEKESKRQAGENKNQHPQDIDFGDSEPTSNRPTVSPKTTELLISDFSSEEYPPEPTGELLRNHSRSVELMKISADQSPGLDSRINTSTKLLLRGDRKLVKQDINEAKNKLETNQEYLSSAQENRVRSQINRAENLVDASNSPTTARSTTELLDERKEKLRNIYTAWSIATEAERSITQSTPVSISIESRGDPIRNNSSAVRRNITGIVEGAEPEDIDEVFVTVNNNQTVSANITQANSARFSASVVLDKRINTITASVRTISSSDSTSRSTASTDSTSGTVDTTRNVPISQLNSGDTEYFSIGTTSATVSFDERSTIQTFTMDSDIAAEQSFGRLQAYRFDPVSNNYQNVEGEPITGVDVVLRESSSIATEPADVTFELNKSRISESSILTILKYNQQSEKWTEQDTSTERSGNSIIIETSNVSNPSSMFVIVDSARNNIPESTDEVSDDKRTPSITDSERTETRITQNGQETLESNEQETETVSRSEQSGGIISSVIESIRELIQSLPVGTVRATSTGVEQPAQDDISLERTSISQTEQEPATDSTVLFIDGDGVTDTFETANLGSDPLNPNSNLSVTSSNDASNAIVDGAEDPDNDSELNAGESALGTNPVVNDTDGDGLSDGAESQLRQFNVTTQDTNGDGISDGQSDPDDDEIVTADEIQQGTDPFSSDTDADGLSDSEEVSPPESVSATNPLAFDTDGDGLSDSEEIELGTDPTITDSDADGIIDGNETFTTSANNVSIGASVNITGEGNIAKGVSISEDETRTLNTTTVQDAQASPIINFESEEKFSSANVSIDYNPSQVSNESELSVYRFNDTNGSFQPLNSTVNQSTNTVTGNTEQFSRFVVFEVPEWESNYNAIEPPNVGDDQSIAPVDAAFILDSSGSMSRNDPNDVRKQAAKEFAGALLDIDRASVIDFDFDAQLTQPLTSDLQAVNNSIDQIDSRGGTNIGAGIDEANSEYAQNSNASRAKIAILLTDGRGSGGISEAERAAQQNITIFTIGLSGQANSQKLKTIANETGGNFTQINQAEDLPEVFSRIANTTEAEDSDGDGLSDAEEIGGIRTRGGQTPTTVVRTDPFDPDTDGDGITDGAEAGAETTNTVRVDIRSSSGNSLQETFERTIYQASSNPTETDSDQAGLSDAVESRSHEVKFTNSSTETTQFKDTVDAVSNPSLDIEDVDPFLSSKQVSPNALTSDSDFDGISDQVELRIGTDPTSADTDGDNIEDQKERNLESTDPTLFDSQRPEVVIESISVSTVPDEEGDLTDVFDTKYTVRYTVKDPAGVSEVIVKRGDDTNKTVHQRTNVTNTVSVVAESFLAQVSQFAFGARINIKANDANGNGQFVTKAGPDIHKKSIKILGNNLPNLVGNIPVFTLATLSGFVTQVKGALESFYNLVKSLLTNPSGKFAQLFEQIEELAFKILQSPVDVIKAFAGTLRSDMLSDNPFSGTNTVLNLIDGPGRFSDGFQPADIGRGVSDFLAFALGWYAGYFGATAVADGISAVLTGGASLAASFLSKIAGFITKLAAKITGKIITGITAIATGDRLSAVARLSRLSVASERIDKFDPVEMVIGLRGVSEVRAVETFEIISDDLSLSLTNALDIAADNLSITNTDGSRLLSSHLAANGIGGVSTIQAAQAGSPKLTSTLLSESTPATKRILTDGLETGKLTQTEVRQSLRTIRNSSNQAEYNQIISQSGIEGVKFISSGGPQSRDIIKTVKKNPETDLTALASLIRIAGGRNLNAVSNNVSPQFIVELLELNSGAATGASENLIQAINDGSVNKSQATQFIDTLNSKPKQERTRTINELAFAQNTTEAERVVIES